MKVWIGCDEDTFFHWIFFKKKFLISNNIIFWIKVIQKPERDVCVFCVYSSLFSFIHIFLQPWAKFSRGAPESSKRFPLFSAPKTGDRGRRCARFLWILQQLKISWDISSDANIHWAQKAGALAFTRIKYSDTAILLCCRSEFIVNLAMF